MTLISDANLLETQIVHCSSHMSLITSSPVTIDSTSMCPLVPWEIRTSIENLAMIESGAEYVVLTPRCRLDVLKLVVYVRIPVYLVFLR